MFDAEKITQSVIQQVSAFTGHFLRQIFIGGGELTPFLSPSTSWQEGIFTLSPLREQVETLCQYVDGQGDYDPLYIAETIQSLCELLFISPGSAYSYDIPNAFWGTDLGQLIIHARLKVSGDELLTISQAAELLFGENTQTTRMRIARMLERGDLTRYTDAAEANPQHAARVSKAEVMSHHDRS